MASKYKLPTQVYPAYEFHYELEGKLHRFWVVPYSETKMNLFQKIPGAMFGAGAVTTVNRKKSGAWVSTSHYLLPLQREIPKIAEAFEKAHKDALQYAQKLALEFTLARAQRRLQLAQNLVVRTSKKAAPYDKVKRPSNGVDKIEGL